MSKRPRVGALCATLHRQGRRAVWFQGSALFPERTWIHSGLLALDPTPLWEGRTDSSACRDDALGTLDQEFLSRRLRSDRIGSQPAQSGIAVLMQYGALGLPDGGDGWRDGRSDTQPDGRIGVDPSLPSISILAVDDSVICSDAAPPDPAPAPGLDRAQDPTDSLVHRDWIDSVESVQARIAAGDLYQANLCRRISFDWNGSPVDYFAALTRQAPAPQAALWLDRGWSVASASPERFFRIGVDGAIVTEPIKGTRPRSPDPERDAALAAELLGSPKDRAELLMIVDLERNDLGRICEPGSIRADRVADLVSFPAVHHLVAQVKGQLRQDWRPSEVLRAIYPGGSITGAPKRRSMQLLSDLEPQGRGFFTGSLLWFGDDGRVDSSLLIRTAVMGPEGRVSVGAGCGIVADSDPEAEWDESNHKARALTEIVGLDSSRLDQRRGS